MVRSQFGSILKEFESFFNCSLNPDENNSCMVRMGIGINIQMELDRHGLLLIGCQLGVVHMGRYRDDLIRAALKSNDATLPSTGILAFSQKSSQLILFTKFDPNALLINQITHLLPLFVTKAKQWTEAIAKGEVPPSVSTTSSKTPSGLFGLIS